MKNIDLNTSERYLLLHLVLGELTEEEEKRLGSLGGHVVRLSNSSAVFKEFVKRPTFAGWPTYLSGRRFTLERDLNPNSAYPLNSPISVSYDEVAKNIAALVGKEDYMEAYSVIRRGGSIKDALPDADYHAISGLVSYVDGLREPT